MGRDYGRVRGRRSSSAVWQWLIIGSVLGFGCAAVIVLAGLTLGFIGLDLNGTGIAAGPTQTAVVVTATTDPNAVTEPQVEVVVVTATPDLEATITAQETAVADSQIVPPTATIEPTPTLETAVDAAAPTSETASQPEPTAPTTDTTTTQTTGATSQTIPPELVALVSPLVPVEGGTFEMGTNFTEISEAVRLCEQLEGNCLTSYGEDSQPARPVTLDAFQIERTEVSYDQYVAFLNYLLTIGRDHTNGCGTTIPQRCTVTRDLEDPNSNITFSNGIYGVALESQRNIPVIQVTWYGADAYCRTIGRRLPTEAEWERAARGPSNFLYPWGNEWNPDNAKTNRSTDTAEGPVPVDSYTQGVSGYGALNMAGNVAEWVADWYSPRYYSEANTNINPAGPLSGVERVVRGGSWPDQPFFSRSVHRQSFPPNNEYVFVGFRCAADEGEAIPGGVNTSASGTSTTTGAGDLPEGTIDPLELGRIDDPNDGGSAPALPTAPGDAVATQSPEDIATLSP